MFDYRAWVDRARQFTERCRGLPGELEVRCDVAPPLNRAEVDRLDRSLPLGLPPILRTFLTKASGNCSCHYWWQPPKEFFRTFKRALGDKAVQAGSSFLYGGATLCASEDFADYQQARSEWAEEVLEEESEDHAIWLRSVPFAAIGNGDYLGLDTETDQNNPPVTYMGHDGGSSVIAESFDTFLESWESVCYIGPEGWMLDWFLDEETGYLDQNAPRASALRELLGVAS